MNCKRTEKEVVNLFRCQKCSAGLYCSSECRTLDSDNHKTFCENIVALEKLEKNKKFSNFDISYDTPLKPNQQMKLVKLIGHKPMINFTLNDKNFEGLWDTGSMISLVNLDWLKTEFNDIQIDSIEKFVGEKSPNLTLRTANNTEMKIIGIVTFHFSIPNLQNKFTVPFIVTSNDIAKPIIGFNIIEHLVKESSSDSFNPISNIFPNMKENKTELITNLIQENSKISDVIGTVKSAENIKITPNSFSFVKCKYKSNVIGRKTIPVIFQPTFDLSLELTLTENLVTLNPSKSRLIKIPVFNPTAKDIFIRSGSLMGNLERVATAIPLELKPIEIPADVSKIEVDIKAPKNKTK